jgi:hypothetical protein
LVSQIVRLAAYFLRVGCVHPPNWAEGQSLKLGWLSRCTYQRGKVVNTLQNIPCPIIYNHIFWFEYIPTLLPKPWIEETRDWI